MYRGFSRLLSLQTILSHLLQLQSAVLSFGYSFEYSQEVLKKWDVKSLTLRSDSAAIMTTFLRDGASVTSPIGTCNMTPGYCENFLSNSEHCEPKKMLSCVSGKVLCGPLTTVLFTVLKYDVITTRYKWNSMPDYGEIFVNSVLGKAKNLRLIFLSAKRLLASRSSWDADSIRPCTLPHIRSGVVCYAIGVFYCVLAEGDIEAG